MLSSLLYLDLNLLTRRDATSVETEQRRGDTTIDDPYVRRSFITSLLHQPSPQSSHSHRHRDSRTSRLTRMPKPVRPVVRLAEAAARCAAEASVYGKCIVADYNHVHKDKCLAEFMKLKDCYLVSSVTVLV